MKTHPMYIVLPLSPKGCYDFMVDWGDGHMDHIVTHNQAEVKHTYARAGAYTLHLDGILKGFAFGLHQGSAHLCSKQIIDISQWGCVRLANTGFQFYKCYNLNASAVDVLDLAGVTDMSNMFNCATQFNGDLSKWDVSRVTNMQNMFYSASAFNSDLSAWNTSSVTNMSCMFAEATSFPHDVSGWNTTHVVDRRFMFRGSRRVQSNTSPDSDTGILE